MRKFKILAEKYTFCAKFSHFCCITSKRNIKIVPFSNKPVEAEEKTEKKFKKNVSKYFLTLLF